MTRRRATGGGVRVMGDARTRRASQAAAVGQVAGKGQGVDASGRVVPVDGPEFYRGADGALHLRLGDFLAFTPGSPKRLTIPISKALALAIQTEMEITGDDVLVPDPDNPGTPESPGTVRTVTESLGDFGETLSDHTTSLAALETNKQDVAERGTTYASLVDGFVPLTQLPFVAGIETLIPGDAVEVSAGGTFDMSDGTYAVLLTRRDVGSSPGHIYADPAEYTTKFFVRSTDALDDATFSYLVVKLT